MGIFDICDYCRERLQVLWSINIGRLTIYLYNNLSELIELRRVVDEMMEELQKIIDEEKKKFKK